MNTHMKKNNVAPRRAKAFTLMELMVSMAVAAVLTTLVAVLFNQTRNATKLGEARSTIGQRILVLDDIMRQDFEGMVGPSFAPIDGYAEAGCLVIAPGLRTGLMKSGLFENEVALRSDQMAFFYSRKVNEDVPLLTGAKPDYLSSLTLQRDENDEDGDDDVSEPATASQARIWYGHVTTPNETESALSWTLGRHAALMVRGNSLDFPPFDTSIGTDIFEIGVGTDSEDPSPLAALAFDTVNTVPTALGYAVRNNYNSATGPQASYKQQYNGTNNAREQYYTDRMVLINNRNDHVPPAMGAVLYSDNSEIETSDLTENIASMLDNCSEFIVQFAVDDDGDGQMQNNENGTIRWFPEDHEVQTNANMPGPFVFAFDDANPKLVAYGYYQAPGPENNTRGVPGKKLAFQNRYGHLFPYPMSKQHTIFPSIEGKPVNHPTAPAGVFNSMFGQGLYDPGNSFQDIQGDDYVSSGYQRWGVYTESGNTGTTDFANGLTGAQSLALTQSVNPARGEFFGLDENGNNLPDWREDVSSWPFLLRIRVRVHDPSGQIRQANEALLINGRDDDGDGDVEQDTDNDGRFGEFEEAEPPYVDYDNDGIFGEPANRVDIDGDGRFGENEPRDKDEERGAGVWYEMIFALPYPRIYN